MLRIVKAEATFTKDIDEQTFETDMLVASNYQPRITYLSRIDDHYWWNPDPATALLFATFREAAAVIAAYRKHQGDLHSLIRIVRA